MMLSIAGYRNLDETWVIESFSANQTYWFLLRTKGEVGHCCFSQVRSMTTKPWKPSRLNDGRDPA